MGNIVDEKLGNELARLKMRQGKIWYWCGFSLLICAAILFVMNFFVEENAVFVIGRIVLGLCAGFGFLALGRKQIAEARKGILCEGCEFIHWDVKKGVWFCASPQPPKYDQRQCYSRKQKETQDKLGAK